MSDTNEFTRGINLSPPVVVEAKTLACEILESSCLKGVSLYKEQSVYKGADGSINTNRGQYDLGVQRFGRYGPASTRVTKSYELRQPTQILDAIDVNRLQMEFDLGLSKVDFKKQQNGSPVGVVISLEKVLDEEWQEGDTMQLGNHSLNIDIGVNFDGKSSDNFKAYIVDCWCTNGCTRKNGIFSGTSKHHSGLLDRLDGTTLREKVREHLNWKLSLSHQPLEETLLVSTLKVLTKEKDSLHDFLYGIDSTAIAKAVHDTFEAEREGRSLSRINPEHPRSRSVITDEKSWKYRGWEDGVLLGTQTINKIALGIEVEDTRGREDGSSRHDFDAPTRLDLLNVVTRIAAQGSGYLTGEQNTRLDAIIGSV
jgi:hypothetical protein